MTIKQRGKSSQLVKTNNIKPNTTFGIIIPNRKRLRAKDILSIHSQLIRKFISGEINSQSAKDLSYLCSNYLSALRDSEMEERLNKIEAKIKQGV